MNCNRYHRKSKEEFLKINLFYFILPIINVNREHVSHAVRVRRIAIYALLIKPFSNTLRNILCYYFYLYWRFFTPSFIYKGNKGAFSIFPLTRIYCRLKRMNYCINWYLKYPALGHFLFALKNQITALPHFNKKILCISLANA